MPKVASALPHTALRSGEGVTAGRRHHVGEFGFVGCHRAAACGAFSAAMYAAASKLLRNGLANTGVIFSHPIFFERAPNTTTKSVSTPATRTVACAMKKTMRLDD